MKKTLRFIAILFCLLHGCDKEDSPSKIVWYCSECCDKPGNDIEHIGLAKWECEENNAHNVNNHTWTWSWKKILDCGKKGCLDPPKDPS